MRALGLLILLLNSILLPSLATANIRDVSDLLFFAQIKPLCDKGVRSCNSSEKNLVSQITWNCEVQVKNSQCADLAKKNPTWAPLMKKCDFESICREAHDYHTKKALACGRGYKNALVDTGVALKNVAVSGANAISDGWKNFLKNNKDRKAYLQECDKSLACKKELAQSLFPNAKMTDEKLKKTTAESLWQSHGMARDHEVRRIENAASAENIKNLKATVQSIKNLKGLVSSKVAKQYSRYSCYTELAKEELECYAIGTVVDPTLVVGYFGKGIRASVAIKELGAEARTVRTANKVVDNSTPKNEVQVVLKRNTDSVADNYSNPNFKVPTFSRNEFGNKYLYYNPTTVAQNEKWIGLAGKSSNKNSVFFDVENSQMKYLNDHIKDKNLVTSLTNYHKELTFKKIQQLVAKNPGLEVSQYSDFKSARFAFTGKVPKDLNEQLKRVFHEANDEFSKTVNANKLVRSTDAPQGWFRAGIGNSADEANLAARYSRQQKNNELQNFGSPALKKGVQTKINSLNGQRKGLQKELSQTSMVSGNSFDVDVFDIVRKNEGSLSDTRDALKARYGLKTLSDSTVQKMQNYVKGVDEFAPGIHISQRVVANLDQASKGGLSADIIGMGGANLKGTADALAGTSDVASALAKARAGEKAVTAKVNQQKSYFEQVIKDSVEPGKLKSLCSGDDCVAVAVKPLVASEKEKIVSRLANSEYAGSYRLAFVNDGVRDANVRNTLATHGESVEKILRKSLGTQMEPRKLKGLTFAIDMQTKQLNSGNLKLILGNSNNAKLTASERKLIESEFRQAVDKFNIVLIKSSGAKATYKSAP